MWRLAVRSVTAHRARLAMTLATVAVGTGFVAGTLAFSAAAEQAERSISQRGDVAVQVRPADAQGHLPRSTVMTWPAFRGSHGPTRWCRAPARCWAGTARWSRTPVG